MSMMTMLELECWRASSSHVVRWLKVSRLDATFKHNHISTNKYMYFAKHK